MDKRPTDRLTTIMQAARQARDKLADIAINPASYTEEDVLRLDAAAAEAWSILNDALEAVPLSDLPALGSC
jgi:hypothetical protein